MREHLAAAKSDLLRAIELEPRNPVPYGEMIRIFKASGSHAEMAKFSERLLEIDPANYTFRRRWIWANELRWGGTYEEMERIGREAQAYVEQNPRLRVLLGFPSAFRSDVAYDKRDYALALALVEEALKHGDFGAEWSWQKAQIHLSLSEWRSAEAAFTRVLEIHPDGYRAYARRGLAKIGSLNLTGALQDLDRAVELAPDDKETRELRVAVLKRFGRWEAALEDYRKLAEWEPENPQRLVDLANAQRMHLDKLDKADTPAGRGAPMPGLDLVKGNS